MAFPSKKKVVLRDGDILSVDTGATVDGWVGDNALDVRGWEDLPSKNAKLLKVTEECSGPVWTALSLATI